MARGERDPLIPSDADYLVQFDPKDDPDNPRDWKPAYKWFVVVILALIAFTVTFTCVSIVPIATTITKSVSPPHTQPSKSSTVLLITIWELGESIGPLIIAPLSERHGRLPLIHAANALFILGCLMTALAVTPGTLIAARAMTGLAVATNVLSPAIVGDVFAPQERGVAMSFVMLAPLVGGAVGPAMAGWLVERAGWRAVVWVSVVLASLSELLVVLALRETYAVAILRRRARILRRGGGGSRRSSGVDGDGDIEGGGGGIEPRRFRTVWDDEGASETLLSEICKPMVILANSSILQVLSLFGAVGYSYFFIISTSFSDILQDIYHMSPKLTGLSYISLSAGSAVSMFVCKSFLDKIYIRLKERNQDDGQPEYRLPLTIVGGTLLPLSLLFYGWITALHLPIALLLLSVGILGAMILLPYIPLMTYIVDAFGRHSASAMTSLIVMRCLAGTFLPLGVEKLTEKFGYGYGLSIVSICSLFLCPIPIMIYRYGRMWRQHSKYTKS